MNEIYIDADHTLTDVRKRLEQLPATIRTVTLVFDRQTQLRNPMDWKNLRAYARNQERDVLIISPDPHLRAMAQSANFKVAASMEASATGKTPVRPHPTRRAGTSKSRVFPTPPARTPQDRSDSVSAMGREGTGSTFWPAEQTRQPSPSPLMPQTPRSVKRPPEPLSTRDRRAAELDEITTGSLQDVSELSPISSTFDEYDRIDEIERSAQFEQEYDQYEYPSDVTTFRPLSPKQLEEEPDMLLEDVTHAQDIRRAASKGREQESEYIPITPEEAFPARIDQQEPRSKLSPLPSASNDVFELVDEPEWREPRMAEQRGAAFIEGLDTSEHPIRNISALSEISEGDEIEYDGKASTVQEAASSTRSWADILREDESYEDLPRVHGMRPRSSRSGKLPASDVPIEDRPTQTFTPQPPPAAPRTPTPPFAGRPAASASGSSTTNRTAKQAVPPQPLLSRPAPRSVQAPVARNTRTSAAPGGTGRPPQRVAPGRRRTSRQEIRSNALMIGVAVAFLLLLGSLALFVPSATVTITLAAHSFSTSAKLTANTGKTQIDNSGVIPAVLLSQTFPLTGGPLVDNGTATGTAHIGTAKASGNVIFTNTGAQALDIPQNTVLATNSGVQFVTAADAVADIQGSRVGNTVQVPITAQSSGEVGNVPVGSITIIPTSSLSQIAGANGIGPNAIKLNVSNTAATSGGGVGTATTVTQADLDKAKAALATQLQGDVNTWLKENVHSNDVAGTPVTMIDVVKAPTVGQIEDNGSFAIAASLRASVLVVRSTVVQAAAQAVMNEALRQSKNFRNYNVVTNTRYPLQISQMQVKSSGVSQLALSFIAVGKIVSSLSESHIQSAIVGKPKGDILSLLRTLSPDIQAVNVETMPGFISWLPFWSARIAITYVPGTVPVTPVTHPTAKPTVGVKK